MSRKDDLELHAKESYRLVREYEEILQYSDNPKEKLRAKREAANQWELISGYLKEYVSLCFELRLTIPPDIGEIIVAAHIPLPSPAPSQRAWRLFRPLRLSRRQRKQYMRSLLVLQPISIFDLC